MPCVLFKEPDKIGNIFVPEVACYLIYLVRCYQQVSFGLQYDIFINEFRTGFAQHCFSDCIELIDRKIQHTAY